MNQSQDHKTSLPGQSSNLPANETVVSIIHYPNHTQQNDELVALVDHQVTKSYEPPDPPIQKQWLEQLLTPWGIGALLILLFANMLLSLAQWSTEKQQVNTTTQSQTSFQESSLSKPVTVTPKSSGNLAVDRLSLLSVPSKSAPHTPTHPLSQTPSKTPAPTAVAPKKASNLTNALLPPSLQPQLLQNYSPSVVPTPSVSQALPVMPVSQPQPVSPSRQPAPSPSVTQNIDKKALLEQERVFEQIRIREQKPEPLGFNHETRAKLRSADNQENSSQLTEQLQQLQQQTIDESNLGTPMPMSKPAH